MANGLGASPDILGGISRGLQLREQFESRGPRREAQQLKLQGTRDTARINSIIQGAQQLKGISDPQRKIEFLQQRRAQLQQANIGTQDTDEALALAQAGRFDELEGITDRAISLGQRGGEQFTLSPGQTRFGPGGQPVAALADRPKADVVQKQVNTLRNSVKDVTKTFRTVEESFNRINAVKPTAAGDLALIFNFMKMLDPGSTVREGEFATAQNATGVDDRVRNTFNRLITGERLNVDQRKDFLGQAENLFGSQRESTDNQISNILQQADQDEIGRIKVLGKERLSDFDKRIAARSQPQVAAPVTPDVSVTPAAPIFSSKLNREVSEQDIEETLAKNPGVTREQLLQQLGIQ